MSEETRAEVDVDIHVPEYRDQGIRIEGELRDTCPVAWTEHYGGHWLISGHHALGAGLRDRERFSAAKEISPDGTARGGVTIPSTPGFRALPNESDPPQWNWYRKLVAPTFSPAAVDKLRPKIEMYANEVIDHMVELGEADFVMQVGSPVTALLTLDVVGLPLEDWRSYAEPIHQKFMGVPGDETEEGIPGIHRRLAETIAARRITPEHGLLDDLIASQIDGEPTPDDVVKDLLYDVLIGGFDTTAGLLGGALVYLEGKREIHERLIEDDDYLRLATEEFLRYISPAVGMAKTATQDYEIDGQQIKSGDRMWFMYRAANRDPEVFVDPDEIDLERMPNPHYAFGAGIHRCLGSNLARAVFQTVLRTFLQRIPDDHVVKAERYRYAALNAGYAELLMTFTPGKKLSDERILATL